MNVINTQKSVMPWCKFSKVDLQGVKLTGTEARILFLLAAWMHQDNTFQTSIGWLAGQCHVSKRHILECLSNLRKQGIIESVSLGRAGLVIWCKRGFFYGTMEDREKVPELFQRLSAPPTY